MFDTPRNGWVEDFKRRYAGTYGFFTTPSNKRILVYVSNVRNTHVEFQDAGGVQYIANNDTGVQFEFIQVPRAWYNREEGGPILLMRRPATQWNRGVSERNTMAYTLQLGRLRHAGISFHTLAPLENPLPYINKIKDSGVALSSAFALYGGFIYLYDRQVGTYKGNNFSVNKIVLQEFSDLAKRINLEGTINGHD